MVCDRWRGGVPRCPGRAFVVRQPGGLDWPPLAPVELRAVGVLGERHADERAVGAVAPAVVRALELDRVALVVTAHLHAAMPARVEKDADPSRAVAAQDDRLLAHRRREIVARLRDLALVADEEPGAGEDPLELLPVDLLAHEDLAADDPALDVDQALQPCRRYAGHAQLLLDRRPLPPWARGSAQSNGRTRRVAAVARRGRPATGR